VRLLGSGGMGGGLWDPGRFRWTRAWSRL